MLSPRHKISLSAIVFLAVIFALTLFVFRPLWLKIKEKSQSLAESESTLEALGEQLDIFQQFQTNSLVYQEYTLILDNFFIQQSAPIRFMEFIESQAAEVGLSLDVQALTLHQPNQQDDFGFRLKVEGPYPGALKFLSRLEEAPWLIDLPQLTIQRYTADKRKRDEETELKEGEVILTITVKAVPPEVKSSKPNNQPGDGPG